MIFLVAVSTDATGQTAQTTSPSPLISSPSPTIRLPPNPKDIAGFSVKIDWAPQESVGYFPIQVTVSSTTAFAADQQILLRFVPLENGYAPPANGLAIELPITVSQGSKQHTITRYVPKWCVGNGYTVRVYSEGSELNGYTKEVGSLVKVGRLPPKALFQGEVSVDFLVVQDNKQPKYSNGFPFTSLRALANGQRVRIGSQNVLNGAKHRLISREILPDDWRGYHAFDAVMIDQSTLEKVKQTPEKIQALRHWVLSGGTLIVLESDSLKSAAELLGVKYDWNYEKENPLAALQQKIAHDETLYEESLEKKLKFSKRYEKMTEVQKAVAIQNETDFALLQSQYETSTQIETRLKALYSAHAMRVKSQNVRMQPVSAGRLIAMGADNQSKEYTLGTVMQIFGMHKSPLLRRGVDPMMGDKRVARWTIPGVAEPPVYAFIGLLAAFVFLVGPVAYRQTTKMGRGYLMFAIAPILATVTTVSMLTYGVVSDGFGTQARIRQLTWVDGKSGDAIERVRATYFAGVSPREGLNFPADAEVMNYPNHDKASWQELSEYEYSDLGTARIGEDGQSLDSRLVPSRTQRQFVFHHPRRQMGRLRFKPALLTQSEITIENDFDFDLRDVVIRDQNGGYWIVDRIAGKSDGKCKRTNAKDASRRLGLIYNQNRPLARVREARNSRYSSRLSDLITQVGRAIGGSDANATDGSIEYWLQQQLQVHGDLPKNYFVATASISDDVVSIDGTEQVASVRFVFGTLP